MIFFFKNLEKNESVEKPLILFRIKKPIEIIGQCSVCFTPDCLLKNVDRRYCQHTPDICENCLQFYLIQMMNEEDEIRCPYKNCTRKITMTQISKFNIPVELTENYSIRTERKNKFKQGLILCANPRCSNGFPSQSNALRIQCEFCSTYTCLVHGIETSLNTVGLCCHIDLENFTSRRIKRCTYCKKPIEKNGGCNHMTCTCGYQFCWQCMGAYIYGHFERGICQQHSDPENVD